MIDLAGHMKPMGGIKGMGGSIIVLCVERNAVRLLRIPVMHDRRQQLTGNAPALIVRVDGNPHQVECGLLIMPQGNCIAGDDVIDERGNSDTT